MEKMDIILRIYEMIMLTAQIIISYKTYKKNDED